MIIRKPKLRLGGVVFDGDRDFEGPRSPKAHLDTVKYKPTAPRGHPDRSDVLVSGRKNIPGKPIYAIIVPISRFRLTSLACASDYVRLYWTQTASEQLSSEAERTL